MKDLNCVSRSEVYRYMGFRGDIPESNIIDMTEDIIKETAEASSVNFCAVDTDIKIEGDNVNFNCFSMKSADLAKHLSHCSGAIIFAATLGGGVDRLIYKYSLMSPARAVAAQAAASAMIEMYADDVCDIFAEAEKKNGLFITQRFSPGYGDLSLEHQKDFLSALNAHKRIGLCLTDSDMLTPVKSITAVVGKTKKEQECNTKKCVECDNTNCTYRK